MTGKGFPTVAFACIWYFHMFFKTDLENWLNLRDIFRSKVCLKRTNIFDFRSFKEILFFLRQIHFFCFVILYQGHQCVSLPFNYLKLNIMLRRLSRIYWKSLWLSHAASYMLVSVPIIFLAVISEHDQDIYFKNWSINIIVTLDA